MGGGGEACHVGEYRAPPGDMNAMHVPKEENLTV